MELDHEYGQLAQIKNLTDEVLHLKETLSTCQCTEQLLAARCAMPPGDTRPGRAAHANPYAVDVHTGGIFGSKKMTVDGSKEMTVEELKNILKTIEAEYERCTFILAHTETWLKKNEYPGSLFHEIYEARKNKKRIYLPVYKTKIKRLNWLIEHSKDIAKNPALRAQLEEFDALLKYMKDCANVELKDLEQKRLLTEENIRMTDIPDPPKYGGVHNFFKRRWG